MRPLFNAIRRSVLEKLTARAKANCAENKGLLLRICFPFSFFSLLLEDSSVVYLKINKK